MKLTASDIYGLKDLALETGSTLEYGDGRKFNSGGLQATRKPVVAPLPQPEPEEPEEPDEPEPPHPELLAVLRQLIEAVKRPVQVTLPAMPTPQVTVKAAEQQATAPKAWTFDFERNSNGTIKRINAKSTEI